MIEPPKSHNPHVLDEDRRREAALIEQDGRDRWPHAPRAPASRMNLYLDDDSAQSR